MADRSRIEWCDATWNPIVGCTPASPACAHCYAARLASRFNQPGRRYHGIAAGGRWTGRVSATGDDSPLRWRKPRRIFVCSMGDLFHERVPDCEHDLLAGIIDSAQQHTYMMLTKRPERARDVFARLDTFRKPCVWLGVTAEDQQRADERIPILLGVDAAVRFVSCEPLLGPVDLSRWLRCDECRWYDAHPGDDDWCPSGIVDANVYHQCGCGEACPLLHWVIVGGETGPRARAMRTPWVQALRRQCVDVGVPFFFKKWGDAQRNATIDTSCCVREVPDA